MLTEVVLKTAEPLMNFHFSRAVRSEWYKERHIARHIAALLFLLLLLLSRLGAVAHYTVL
jgi:hypothetical protein